MSFYRKILPVLLTGFILFFLRVVMKHLEGLPHDTKAWLTFTTYIQQHGLSSAYSSGSNYPPLYHYVLWIFAKINGSPEQIRERLHYLRIFTFLFDLWGLWLITKWTNARISFTQLLVLSILNLAYFYNTIVWGQVDGIMATLVFAALYYGYKQQWILSGLMMALAWNMKLQAVIFLPLWGLMLIYQLAGRQVRWPAILKMTGVIVVIQVLLLLPFIQSSAGRAGLEFVLFHSVDYMPVISVHAFNLWYLVAPGDPRKLSDQLQVLSFLNYKQLGLLLFFATSLAALWPLLSLVWQRIRHRSAEAVTYLSREMIWLTGALVCLLFFFFNTQMHERYSHYAFIFLTAYSIYRRDIIPYLFFSVIYFFLASNLRTPTFTCRRICPCFITPVSLRWNISRSSFI